LTSDEIQNILDLSSNFIENYMINIENLSDIIFKGNGIKSNVGRRKLNRIIIFCGKKLSGKECKYQTTTRFI
jgi:hypothetical protein